MSRNDVNTVARSIVLAGLLIALGIFFGLRGFSDLQSYRHPITYYTDVASSVSLDGSLHVTLDGDIGVSR